METNYSDNNHLMLVGKVTSEKRFSHETYGEKFYIFDLEVARLSDTTDIIPVTASERIINDELLTIGNKLIIKGQFRSYNSYENERNKLILTVFAKDVLTEDKLTEEELEQTKKISNEDEDSENSVESTLVIFGDNNFVSDVQIVSQVNPMIFLANNKDLMLNSIAYLTDNNEDITIRKDYTKSSDFMPTDEQKQNIVRIIFTVPIAIIFFGFVVWQVRRRKK